MSFVISFKTTDSFTFSISIEQLITTTFILVTKLGVHVDPELFLEVIDGELGIGHVHSIDSDPRRFAFLAFCVVELLNVPCSKYDEIYTVMLRE